MRGKYILLAVFCAEAILIACSATDFSKPTNDGGPDVADAQTDGAVLSDAPQGNDGGEHRDAESNGDAATPCVNGHSLCDDFDDRTALPGPQWTKQNANLGASLAIVGAPDLSPPNSLEVSLPQSDASVLGLAYLTKQFATPTGTIECTADVRVDTYDPTGGFTPLSITVNTGDAGLIRYMIDLRITPSLNVNASVSGVRNGDGGSFVTISGISLGSITAGLWTRLRLAVSLSGDGRALIRAANGANTWVLGDAEAPAIASTTHDFLLGASSLSNRGPWVVHIDNVYCDRL